MENIEEYIFAGIFIVGLGGKASFTASFQKGRKQWKQPSPQRFLQYIEVPPNIEAKRIISSFSDVISY